MSDEQRKKYDAVTVGQLRNRQLGNLERQILDLSNLIRQGYFQMSKAEEYLKGPIVETLTRLQNIDALASTEVLCPPTPTPPPGAEP